MEKQMTKRILILGGAGMLGHKVYQIYRRRFDAWTTNLSGYEEFARYDLYDPDRFVGGVDVSNFDSVVRVLADVKPDAVFNCVGIIKQVKAAKDPITSLVINSLFPHRLANVCRASGIRMIHMGTDCVFSGRKGGYTESDISDAEDLYGRTKYLGEVDVPGCLTVRTSIIGRELNTSNALTEWILANKGGKVRGYTKAIYSGYTTIALANIIADVLENHPNLCGMYHVASQPISKFDLLTLINETYSLNIQIEPDDKYVCDRSLDGSRFCKATGFKPPSWAEMISEMHRDPTPYHLWRKK
jgi:dTDP-4-dehydrorhamnose reductase